MSKLPDNWMNMGHAPKMGDGTTGTPSFPSVTMHGNGEAPDLKDGPYMAEMKHHETINSTDPETGEKTHRVTMHIHRMKPMMQSPNTMQGPKASPSFAGRSAMDAGVAAILKSKAAPNKVTQVS